MGLMDIPMLESYWVLRIMILYRTEACMPITHRSISVAIRDGLAIGAPSARANGRIAQRIFENKARRRRRPCDCRAPNVDGSSCTTNEKLALGPRLRHAVVISQNRQREEDRRYVRHSLNLKKDGTWLGQPDSQDHTSPWSVYWYQCLVIEGCAAQIRESAFLKSNEWPIHTEYRTGYQ